PPETTKRFSQSLVEDTVQDFLLTLWNTYSFFVLYANLDKPDLRQPVPMEERPAIDRWLVAKLHELIQAVTERLDDYDPTSASRLIRDFVVNQLSNWYVRRNRRRFWKSANDFDKLSAYRSLYEALVAIAKLIAPMAPFLSEHLYQNLVLSVFPAEPESVHLAQWPVADTDLIDAELLADMATLIRMVELGRSARSTAGVKVRQPLAEILVRLRNEAEQAGLQRLEDQLKEELNVKQVTYLDLTADFVDYAIKPNLPLLGKRLGKRLPVLTQTLATMDSREIVRNIRQGKATVLEPAGESFSLEPEAFFVEAKSPSGYAAVEDQGYLAALNTQLTPQLIQEGLVRDTIRLLQDVRKQAGLDVCDRIYLGLQTSGDLLEALQQHLEVVKAEVLADEVAFGESVGEGGTALEPATRYDLSLQGTELTCWIARQRA
ncbi:MAG: class I tRNA ligase family protein, partial [Cyanobacteria bacterium Co-bin13]|nr:class I tRNA ligase family protein [Cyanobacteria bacterium Co-bin13]